MDTTSRILLVVRGEGDARLPESRPAHQGDADLKLDLLGVLDLHEVDQLRRMGLHNGDDPLHGLDVVHFAREHNLVQVCVYLNVFVWQQGTQAVPDELNVRGYPEIENVVGAIFLPDDEAGHTWALAVDEDLVGRDDDDIRHLCIGDAHALNSLGAIEDLTLSEGDINQGRNRPLFEEHPVLELEGLGVDRKWPKEHKACKGSEDP